MAYKRLGDFIREVNVRNRELKATINLFTFLFFVGQFKGLYTSQKIHNFLPETFGESDNLCNFAPKSNLLLI